MTPADSKNPTSDEQRRQFMEMCMTAAGVGTFDWDLINGTLRWDEQLIELFDYDLHSFQQDIESFQRRLHPDDLDRVTAELQAAIDSKGEFKSEYRIVLTDGKVRWIAARGKTLCDVNDVSIRLLGAAWDITARTAEEATVARGVGAMKTPFFSLDEDWCFSYVNPAAEPVLGLSRNDMVGNSIWELFPAAIDSDFELQYRKVMQTGQSTQFDAYYPAPLDAWFEVHAWRDQNGISVSFLDITARHYAQKMANEAEGRSQLLHRITEELGGTVHSDAAADGLAHLVVPLLADWCIVSLIDDDRSAGSRHGLRTVAALHRNEAMQSVLATYADARLQVLTDDWIVARTMETGDSQMLIDDATAKAQAMFGDGSARDLIGQLAPESIITLPLNGSKGPVGMLTLANDKQRGAFQSADLTTAHHVAARAGLVLDNARLYRQQRELAEGLQRSLLTSPVEPDHVQIVVRYMPAVEAAQVGGDWYDAFMQTNGSTVLVIGDVVGHDAQAASSMGQIRSIVRTIGVLGNDSPSNILTKADHVMESLQADSTATAAVARLEQTDEEIAEGVTRLRWSNAGHLPPAVVKADGSVTLLDLAKADLLLGVTTDAERNDHVFTLERDAIIIFYTDGLVERRGQSIDEGLELLQSTLQKLAYENLDCLCDELLKQLVPDDAGDDVALLAVKLHRQDQARPSEAGPNRVPPNIH